jgi:hypothetical protein
MILTGWTGAMKTKPSTKDLVDYAQGIAAEEVCDLFDDELRREELTASEMIAIAVILRGARDRKRAFERPSAGLKSVGSRLRRRAGLAAPILHRPWSFLGVAGATLLGSRCGACGCIGVSTGAVPSCGGFVIRGVAAFEICSPRVVLASGCIMRCCRALVCFGAALGRSTDISMCRRLPIGELLKPPGDLFASSLTPRC